MLCASFLVQPSTGTCFVKALKYKVVLGSALWEVLCGKCFVGSALCKLSSAKVCCKGFSVLMICVSSSCVQKLSAPTVLLVQKTFL